MLRNYVVAICIVVMLCSILVLASVVMEWVRERNMSFRDSVGRTTTSIPAIIGCSIALLTCCESVCMYSKVSRLFEGKDDDSGAPAIPRREGDVELGLLSSVDGGQRIPGRDLNGGSSSSGDSDAEGEGGSSEGTSGSGDEDRRSLAVYTIADSDDEEECDDVGGDSELTDGSVDSNNPDQGSSASTQTTVYRRHADSKDPPSETDSTGVVDL